jgi:hypothetical protein
MGDMMPHTEKAPRSAWRTVFYLWLFLMVACTVWILGAEAWNGISGWLGW